MRVSERESNKQRDSKRVVRMMRCMVGECTHEVTSRRIGDGWNVRVLLNGQVNQETRVYCRSEIGKAAREMLRWEDKCGNISAFAHSARHRIGLKELRKSL
jgi:hypothetical protein